jgi:hypothetical protein
VRHRQRPKQEGVRKAEHRAVCTDANRERYDRHDCKARVLCEHAARVAEIPDQVFEPEQAALVALGLCGLRDSADSKPRGSLCARLRSTAAPLLVGGEFEMDLEFLFQITIST